MKIWLKYIIGCVLGIIFCLVFPAGNEMVTKTLTFLSEFALRIGRYALYPLLFFSFTMAVYELREGSGLMKTGLLTAAVIAAAAVLQTAVGLVSVLIGSPQRIPMFAEEVAGTISLDLTGMLLQLFPYSAFEIFVNSSFILPLCIFAGFAGAGCAADKAAAKPALNLFDSLSRVCYAVFSFFIDMFAFALIVLAAGWTYRYREMLATALFGELVLILVIDFVIIAGIVYPLLLRLLLGKINPYRVLYASIAPVAAAFFSGDSNVALGVGMRHANESLGVRRRISAVTMPLFSVFSRGGTALTITVSFIIILKSYSSLGIPLQDIFWISGVAIALSFLLGNIPVGGTFIALAILCSMYGRVFESGYLILKPAAFFICAIAAAFDTLTNMFGTYLVARVNAMTTQREVHYFI
ncbi:MAG: dicarboxylate/amino acid:cation symporter [Spirochaetaceae bacterium]|jgi:Na+/H+-dicarboxylate symporter|nr:dicarboxylate/amino acid:cation symporter [Spirochaetaceae bacterium]